MKKLGIPFIVIFTCVARELAHKNGCGSLSARFYTPVLMQILGLREVSADPGGHAVEGVDL
jgi:hypothetical protein